MNILQLVGEFFLFLLAIVFYFYIPGIFILSFSKTKLKYPINVVLPIGVGIVLFTLAAYVFSWVHLQLCLLPLALLILFAARKRKLLSLPGIPYEHRVATMLTFILATCFSFQMIFDGNFGNSIYYFGDDVVHLAYTNEMVANFPPQHPGFAGIPLNGYHFFYDFFLANLSRVSFISSQSLYFHFSPFLVSLGWGFGAYSILFLWTKKVTGALFGVFLVLFGSSFAYMLYFFHYPGFTLSSNFGMNQPDFSLWNTPYSSSMLIVFTTILLMQCYFAKPNKVLLFLIAICVGVAPIFKIYAGMIIFIGFASFIVIELLRKNFFVLWAGIVAGVVALCTMGVFLGSGASIFYFPLWPIERMLDAMFPDYHYKEKIDTYMKYSVIHGIVSTQLYGLSLFLLGNLGTRCVGIILLPLTLFEKKKLRFPSLFACVLFVMIASSVLIPLFFAQTINVFDMIQMTYYYPVLMSLFAAVGLSYFFSLQFPNIIKMLLICFFVLFTLPLYYSSSKTYFSFLTAQRSLLSSEYFQAMHYLATHGSYQETILEVPLGAVYTQKEALLLWLKGYSNHLAAFGNKRMYIGNALATFPNMPFEQRLILIGAINEVENNKYPNFTKINNMVEQIKKEKIVYLYTTQPLKYLQHDLHIVLVFRNSQAIIYKVN